VTLQSDTSTHTWHTYIGLSVKSLGAGLRLLSSAINQQRLQTTFEAVEADVVIPQFILERIAQLKTSSMLVDTETPVNELAVST